MNTEAWIKLIHGHPLAGGEPRTPEGRLDMRRLHLDDPRTVKTIRTDIAQINVLAGITEIRGAIWQSIDFSSSRLPGLQFFDCRIRDCLFDRCKLTRLRVWATEFSNDSFRYADLRDCSLGSSWQGRPSIYRDVDFTNADMRRSGNHPAEYINCMFKNTKLSGCHDIRSSFINCSFEGELRDVTFQAHDWENKAAPPKVMKGVDFSRAKFWHTDFRGFDLDDVRFPEDDDHVIVDNIRDCVKRLHDYFNPRPDVGSQRVTAGLEHQLRWMGAGRKTGVFRKSLILEMAGEEGLRALLRIIGKDARGRATGT
ncbi:Uncharacterized protein YjbI, contains pentapeptide repeats [Rhizobiales bacterium GAS188]|nr:Uncharacterized protein YjbI, contains pentapeptide repeats [Rhizobiales bacterium GAS188]